MSTRKLKNLLTRQIISTVKTWFGIQIKKTRRTFKEEQLLLHQKNSRWGAHQLAGLARLGQKIYN
jgi:hypothetical protein